MPAGPVEPLHDRLEDRAPPDGAIGMSLRGRSIGDLFLSRRSRGGRRNPLRDGFAEAGPSYAAQECYGIAATCDRGAELQPGSGESGSGAIVSGPSAGDCVSGGAVAILSIAGRYFRGDDDGAFSFGAAMRLRPIRIHLQVGEPTGPHNFMRTRSAAFSADQGFEEAAASR